MLGVVGLLALGTVASVVVGNMYLEKQASKLNELKVEDRVLEEQQTALKQAKKDLEKYAELEKVAKTIVPQDKDQAKAVLEIIEIAKASGISIKSISFPTSNLGSKPAAPQSNTNSAEGGESKPAQEKTAPISQAKPVEGITGVYSLEMNIVPEGDAASPISYYQFLDFLGRLENNRRTAQVTQIKVVPQGKSKDSSFVTFTLTINIFVKP